MDTTVNPYISRIVIKPDVRSGRPCVRDTRITVQEILRWLASGATQEEILADYPFLEKDGVCVRRPVPGSTHGFHVKLLFDLVVCETA